MLHSGDNFIDGIRIEVTRKRIRRINLRVAPGGRVLLSIPWSGATLGDGEAFLRSKWRWVVKTRAAVLARPVPGVHPLGEKEQAALVALLGGRPPETEGLVDRWAAKLNEPAVTWRLRRMKSLWGSCHWRKRMILFNSELARKPLDLVEYVVVHELTHLQAHNHGPRFQALMDMRLPDWRDRRRRLNGSGGNRQFPFSP